MTARPHELAQQPLETSDRAEPEAAPAMVRIWNLHKSFGDTEVLKGVDLDRGIDIFSRGSQAHGARAWTPEDVCPPALYRLYRATVSEHSVLDPASSPNRRIRVTM